MWPIRREHVLVDLILRHLQHISMPTLSVDGSWIGTQDAGVVEDQPWPKDLFDCIEQHWVMDGWVQSGQIELGQQECDTEEFLSIDVIWPRHKLIGDSTISRYFIRTQHIKNDVAVAVRLIKINSFNLLFFLLIRRLAIIQWKSVTDSMFIDSGLSDDNYYWCYKDPSRCLGRFGCPVRIAVMTMPHARMHSHICRHSH